MWLAVLHAIHAEAYAKRLAERAMGDSLNHVVGEARRRWVSGGSVRAVSRRLAAGGCRLQSPARGHRGLIDWAPISRRQRPQGGRRLLTPLRPPLGRPGYPPLALFRALLLAQ
jgi:hypothetical protein